MKEFEYVLPRGHQPRDTTGTIPMKEGEEPEMIDY